MFTNAQMSFLFASSVLNAAALLVGRGLGIVSRFWPERWAQAFNATGMYDAGGFGIVFD